MATQLLLSLEQNAMSARVMLGLGAFGFFSSIPQMKFFGSFGMGIPGLEELLGGWNHASKPQDTASMETSNAWWVGGTPGTGGVGSWSWSKLPVIMFDDAWWCYLQFGLGLGWGATKGSCTTQGKANSVFGHYALWPFVLLMAGGIALGGLSPYVPRLI